MTHSIDKTKDVVTVHTNFSGRCKHCDFNVGRDNFAESVSHYIKSHGYSLLHVGEESDQDPKDGHSISHTVAVLGR